MNVVPEPPDKSPAVEIIATGSELLAGKSTNTNAVYLSSELSRRGYSVVRHQTLGDEKQSMLQALNRGLKESDLLITTGGLGPTLDDITRDVLSEATGIKLHHEKEVEDQIRERFRTVGKEMPELNLCQAQVPEKGGWFPNPHGTAPGVWFDLGSRLAVALPGPPRELKPMFQDHLLPLLRERFQTTRKLLSRSLRVIAFGESNTEELIRPIVQQAPELTYSILASPGVVTVTLSRWVDLKTGHDEKLNEVFQQVREKLGNKVLSAEGRSLEESVGDLFRQKEKTLATAESCTGGLIAESLTRIPGSSDYFAGGFVTYSNEMKMQWLGVDAGLIEHHGAVSDEVARAMAQGARGRCEVDYAIGVTGIAGPGGGTEEKPVGLVYIAVSGPDGVNSERYRFFGDRDAVRERSRVAALNMVRLMLEEE
jgi:nicotinamide-nucleotide amidase